MDDLRYDWTIRSMDQEDAKEKKISTPSDNEGSPSSFLSTGPDLLDGDPRDPEAWDETRCYLESRASEAAVLFGQTIVTDMDRYQSRDLCRTVWAAGRLALLSVPRNPAPDLSDMLDVVAVRGASPGGLDSFDTQSLTLLLYAFARLGYTSGERGRAFLDACADWIGGVEEGDEDQYFDAVTISTAVWSFARLGYHPGRLAMDRMMNWATKEPQVSSFTAQGLCLILWGHAELLSPIRPRHLDVIIQELTNQRRALTPVSASCLCAAAGRLGVAEPRLLALAAEVAVRETGSSRWSFSPRGIATTLYGMARVGFYDQEAWTALAAAARDQLSGFSTQACVNTLWALSQVPHRDVALVQGLANRLVVAMEAGVGGGTRCATESSSSSSSSPQREIHGQLFAHAVYALATMRVDVGRDFFTRAAPVVVRDLTALSPSEVTMTLWGLSALGYQPEDIPVSHVDHYHDHSHVGTGTGVEENDDDQEEDEECCYLVELLADWIYAETFECPLSARDASQLVWALTAQGMQWHPSMLHAALMVRRLPPTAFQSLVDGDAAQNRAGGAGGDEVEHHLEWDENRATNRGSTKVKRDGEEVARQDWLGSDIGWRRQRISAERSDLLRQLTLAEAVSATQAVTALYPGLAEPVSEVPIEPDRDLGGEDERVSSSGSNHLDQDRYRGLDAFAVTLPMETAEDADRLVEAWGLQQRSSTLVTEVIDVSGVDDLEVEVGVGPGGLVTLLDAKAGVVALVLGDEDWSQALGGGVPRRLGGVARVAAELIAAEDGTDSEKVDVGRDRDRDGSLQRRRVVCVTPRGEGTGSTVTWMVAPFSSLVGVGADVIVDQDTDEGTADDEDQRSEYPRLDGLPAWLQRIERAGYVLCGVGPA